jgi:RNA polymerase primary sigma factor
MAKLDSLDSIDSDDAVSLYFREVRPIPLLTREDEVALAKRIERGQLAQDRLEEVGDELDEEERARLKAQVEDGNAAFDAFVQANYRLVIGIAKKYTGHDVPLLDLIQEGNLGLLRAAEKFDYRKGFKFSTYATWWIRQSVTRALADQGRTIRLPIHMKDRIKHLRRVSRRMEKELGRPPTPEEITQEVDLDLAQVELALDVARDTLSLHLPRGDDDDAELGEYIESENGPDPDGEVDRVILSQEIEELLTSLTPREARILAMRYGLRGPREYTLKEVGQKFGLTRERIRQIEQQALRKLRHPRRSRHLRTYLN